MIFYHPNNMFYWDGSNLEELKAFLTLLYVFTTGPRLEAQIQLQQLISCAFNIEPNIPITLPQADPVHFGENSMFEKKNY